MASLRPDRRPLKLACKSRTSPGASHQPGSSQQRVHAQQGPAGARAAGSRGGSVDFALRSRAHLLHAVLHRPRLFGPQKPDQEDLRCSASVAPFSMPYGALCSRTRSRNHPRHADTARRPGRVLACIFAPSRIPEPYYPALGRPRQCRGQEPWFVRRPIIPHSARGLFPTIPAQLPGAKERAAPIQKWQAGW